MMRVLFRHRLVKLLVIVAACAVIASVWILLTQNEAWARPGGGQSFGGSKSSGGGSRSSGGGGGSSGGGGGGGELIGVLISLVFHHPAIGVPLLLMIVGFLAYSAWSKSNQADWSTTSGNSEPMVVARANVPPARSQLEDLRRTDENFSLVLFEDFLYSLYAEVHTARGAGTLAHVSAYLTPEVINLLSHQAPSGVSDVVIGAMSFVRTSGINGGDVYVTVEFESNYTEAYQQQSQSYYMREHWTLRRAEGVKSRTPDRARVFGCPSCGAPQDQVFGGQCKYCKQQVATGNFDWLVTHVQILEREARAPMLTGTTEEQGTDLPTVFDPRATAGFQALMQRDPAQNWDALLQRVGVVFNEFQVAWTARDLLRMRALLSDTLFQTQTYWMKAYEKSGLWNMIERPRITQVELARVTQDKFYDAITVRVFASSIDYTIDARKRVVAGNRNREREYSEYWTFIRGTQRKGPPRTDLGCPNCGAPLVVNMSGACTHCKAKVSTGDFDWVLSRIEQDEVYS